MQRRQVIDFASRAVKAFSILGRIGGDATPIKRWLRAAGAATFSILGRIGGDATTRQDILRNLL